ncbi:MAG: DUF4157 domain-containing protein [Anaerolineae bacterium]|nr:DUF4157 domain-containing protein [Anaerolineae bacterium]
MMKQQAPQIQEAMASPVHAASHKPTRLRQYHLAPETARTLAGQPPLLQARLVLGKPHDRYEQEADQVADLVMQLNELPSPRRPGRPVEPAPLLERITPLVQRQVEPEEEEEEEPIQAFGRIQRQAAAAPEEEKEEEAPLQTAGHIQRQSTPSQEEEKEEEETPVVGFPGSAIARKPVSRAWLQRQSATEKEEEEEKTASRLPREKRSRAIEIPEGFQARLTAEQGHGASLPANTRRVMEARFGVNFDQIRIHTGSAAGRMATDIQAQAFTVGQDIYFGAGYYDPDSLQGQRLIAHELAHTLQQTPALRDRRARDRDIAGGVIRRQQTLTPAARPSGTKIHSEILPAFGESNSDLFTEVRIPGAKKHVVEEGKAGIADFFWADTTIALNFEGGQPVYLGPDTKLRKGKQKWSKKKHQQEGAPIGPEEGSESCHGGPAGKKICRLDKAPGQVLMGDLKPAASVESALGEGQLRDYSQGLTNTAASVDSFAKAHPDQIDPAGKSWTVSPGRISSLTIPPGYAFDTAKTPIIPLGLYTGGKRATPIPGLKGRLVVYKDPTVAGIWVYEWAPTSIPSSLRASASKEFTQTLDRLDRLIQDLRAPPKGATPRKAREPASAPVTRRRTHQAKEESRETRSWFIQRAPKKFNLNSWRKAYTKEWKKPAKKFVKSQQGVSLQTVAAIMDIKERSKLPIKTPSEFRPLAKKVNKVQHWIEWGGTYGILRKAFGGLFEKISTLYEKAKKRFRKLAREKPLKSGGSGLVKAIIKSAFRIAGEFFRIIIGRVANNLKTALGKGITALLEHFFGEDHLAKIIEAKTNLEELEKNLKDALSIKPEELLKKMIEPYEKKLAYLADVGRWLGNISKIVSAVRWAARVINCLTPPGIGCLKLLLQEATEQMLAAAVETCWFQKTFVLPVFGKLEFFKTLPNQISQYILETVKSWIPLNDDLKNRLFADIPPVKGEISEGEIRCDASKLTPEQLAMAQLREKHGRAKVEQLIALLEKGGIGARVPLTLAHIATMDKVLSGVTDAEMRDALANYDRAKASGIVKLDEMVGAIKQTATGGETGGKGAGVKESGIVVKGASEAKFDGTVEVRLPRTHIYVHNPDFVKHTKYSQPKITLIGAIDGIEVARVKDVPSIVTKRLWADRTTQTQLKIFYRILQGVSFEHNVQETPTFVIEANTVIGARATNPWPPKQ